MSEENAEVVRRIYDRWGQGDFAVALAMMDEEVTFETFMPDSKELVVLHGVDRIRAFMLEWFQQFQDYRVTGEEFRAVGTDQVFVAGQQTAVGRRSGAEVKSPAYTLWTFRGGKVVRLLGHYDRAATLEAAGLSE